MKGMFTQGAAVVFFLGMALAAGCGGGQTAARPAARCGEQERIIAQLRRQLAEAQQRCASPGPGRDPGVATDASPRLSPAEPDWSQTVQQVSSHSFRVRRAVMTRVLADPSLVARAGRVVPSIREGQPEGFKLYAVRSQGIWATLGIQNGDTILRVAGVALTSPEGALEAYERVRRTDRFEATIRRGATILTFAYEIVEEPLPPPLQRLEAAAQEAGVALSAVSDHGRELEVSLRAALPDVMRFLRSVEGVATALPVQRLLLRRRFADEQVIEASFIVGAQPASVVTARKTRSPVDTLQSLLDHVATTGAMRIGEFEIRGTKVSLRGRCASVEVCSRYHSALEQDPCVQGLARRALRPIPGQPGREFRVEFVDHCPPRR